MGEGKGRTEGTDTSQTKDEHYQTYSEETEKTITEEDLVKKEEAKRPLMKPLKTLQIYLSKESKIKPVTSRVNRAADAFHSSDEEKGFHNHSYSASDKATMFKK
jgi:hypothetical protein